MCRKKKKPHSEWNTKQSIKPSTRYFSGHYGICMIPWANWHRTLTVSISGNLPVHTVVIQVNSNFNQKSSDTVVAVVHKERRAKTSRRQLPDLSTSPNKTCLILNCDTRLGALRRIMTAQMKRDPTHTEHLPASSLCDNVDRKQKAGETQNCDIN